MGSVAGHHSVHFHTTEDCEVSSSESEPSHDEGDGTREDDNAEEDKGGIKTSSDGQVASDGKEGQSILTPKTPSLVLVRSSVGTRTQTQNWTQERKSGPSGRSGTQKAPRRTALGRRSSESSSSEEEPPTDETLCDEARKKHSCWTHVLMLSITTRLPKVLQAG